MNQPKSDYNTTSELNGANWGTNAKQRMTNWQQVLLGESCLAAFNVHFRASKFKPEPNSNLLAGFTWNASLKPSVGVFPSVEGRSSTAAQKHGSLVPNPWRAFVPSFSKGSG